MEYQGIVTGIGSQDKNLITPQIDAVISDFMVGKNTIIDGLVLFEKNLSKGTCILCGYRGILEEAKELDTVAYVYGKFTLNFDNSIEDSFAIETSSMEKTENVNPSEITSAGTYYLLLYKDGVKDEQLDSENSYGKNAYYSVETENVLDFATIAETTTTETAENDAYLTQPNRVANTEYVHNQIEKLIDSDVYSVTNTPSTNYTEELSIRRRAKFCILTLTITKVNVSEIIIYPKTLFTIPISFAPTNNIVTYIYTGFDDGVMGNPKSVLQININKDGSITCHQAGNAGLGESVFENEVTLYCGYETN